MVYSNQQGANKPEANEKGFRQKRNNGVLPSPTLELQPNFLNTTVHISVNLYYANVIESKEQRNLFHELLLNINFPEFSFLLLETTDHLTI